MTTFSNCFTFLPSVNDKLLFFKTFKMSKKWPFQVPEKYLNVKVSKLRKIHGIDILTSEELNYSPTHWSGAIDS